MWPALLWATSPVAHWLEKVSDTWFRRIVVISSDVVESRSHDVSSNLMTSKNSLYSITRGASFSFPSKNKKGQTENILRTPEKNPSFLRDWTILLRSLLTFVSVIFCHSYKTHLLSGIRFAFFISYHVVRWEY